MKNYCIGVLGGMGTYATIDLFQKYAEVFPAKKEWDRPRIVIDNRCTMPSRVRAYLYDENVNQLVSEMIESLLHLIEVGCNRIILACNTSHLFLPLIYKKVPTLKPMVLNIVSNCVDKVKQDGIREVFIIGSEGTIDSKIYQTALEAMGIKCVVPHNNEYRKIRKCIEAVKQNKFSDEIKDVFLDLIKRCNACILGCTELPILYKRYSEEIENKCIYDPLFLSLLRLKEEYDSVQDINIWSL